MLAISKTQKVIEEISLEKLAYNLYYVGKLNPTRFIAPSLPFQVKKATNLEYVDPNVNYVYNNSDESIKVRMIDSVAWLIENDKKDIPYDMTKISLSTTLTIVANFSGLESNSYFTLDFKRNQNEKLNEESSEIRKYIKNIFREKLLKLSERDPDIVELMTYRTWPMEIMPTNWWNERIKEGYGIDVLFNADQPTSFFGEKSELRDTEKIIDSGLVPENLDTYLKTTKGKTNKLISLHKSFSSMNHEDKTKPFIDVIDRYIKQEIECRPNIKNFFMKYDL